VVEFMEKDNGTWVCNKTKGELRMAIKENNGL